MYIRRGIFESGNGSECTSQYYDVHFSGAATASGGCRSDVSLVSQSQSCNIVMRSYDAGGFSEQCQGDFGTDISSSRRRKPRPARLFAETRCTVGGPI